MRITVPARCLLMGMLLTMGITSGRGEEKSTRYPAIPRIDVHSHPGGRLDAIANYLSLREHLKANRGADLALWINLGSGAAPVTDLDAVMRAGAGRILCCISDYSSHDGLKFPPEELASWLEKGYVGYKIWAGPPHRKLKPGQKGYPYIDDPAHEPTFVVMESIGMVCASIHIADPNGPWGARTKWLPDPVEYWKEITAWRHVLEKHPKLIAVTAHGMWAVCQDAQIDYLRNMLATFPGLHVDLAATFQYYHLVNRDNLRAFMIEYADRILFGTDIGSWSGDENTRRYAERYFRCFRILETDETVEGSFFGDKEIRGLALPREVLERIYYRNAMRVYPKVKSHLKRLEYVVESRRLPAKAGE